MAMQQNIDLNRGHHVLYEAYEINEGLDATVEDASIALGSFENRDFTSDSDKDAFVGVVLHLRKCKGLNADIKFRIRNIAGADPYFKDMLLFAKSDRNRRHRASMTRYEIRNIRDRNSGKNDYSDARQELAENADQLRSGVFRWVYNVACGYLNLYHDMPEEADAITRLKSWLGDDLANMALEGFEAFLTSDKLVSPEQILEAFAEGKRYDLDYPLLCGLYERQRTGRGFSDLSDDVLRMGWYISENSGMENLANVSPIAKILRDELLSRSDDAKAELSRFSELALHEQHAAYGLYDYMTDDDLKPWATSQALEWLEGDKNMSSQTTTLLVLSLIHI